MSDFEEIKFTQSQFQEWQKLETIRNNALWRIAESVTLLKDQLREQLEIATADQGKWLSIQNESIKAGFASVVEAIAKIQLPAPSRPQMKGTIVADYQIPDDQPDGRVTFHLTATDAEGHEITDPEAYKLMTFEAASSDENAFLVTLDFEQPDPRNRVGGYHVGAPGQAAVTSNLKNAEGELIGTGTDGFTVTTGKVTLGSVKSEFEGLTPIGG